MTAQIRKNMARRLTRGTRVIIADTYAPAKMRGTEMVVASKSTVKCNKNGRCAGDWCSGLAVFLTNPSTKTSDEDSAMGWRRNTTKICLTHLKDEAGSLLMPAPISDDNKQAFAGNRISRDIADAPSPLPPSRPGNGDSKPKVVTWEMLAQAHAAGDANRLALLARQLKSENDALTQRTLEAQGRLLDQLLESK